MSAFEIILNSASRTEIGADCHTYLYASLNEYLHELIHRPRSNLIETLIESSLRETRDIFSRKANKKWPQELAAKIRLGFENSSLKI